jgi:hypothetical protein
MALCPGVVTHSCHAVHTKVRSIACLGVVTCLLGLVGANSADEIRFEGMIR